MKRSFILYVLIVLLTIPANVEAQRWKLLRYEASLGAGVSHPFMDVGRPVYGIRSFMMSGSRPTLAGGVRYKIYNSLSVGLDLNYAMFGSVALEDHVYPIHTFRAFGFEHVATVQYDFLVGGKPFGSSALFNRRGMVNDYNTTNFYVFVGGGAILSKSKIFDKDGVELTNINGFHNNMQYGLVFPVGVGMKYNITSYWAFGIEIGKRFSLTDLIEGYASTHSKYEDQYLFTSFKAILKIRNTRNGIPILRRYGYGRF